jgi:hypothetical protein
MVRWLIWGCLLLASLPATGKSGPTPAELAVDHGLVTARFHGTLPDTELGVSILAPKSIGLRPSGGRDDGRDDLHLEMRNDDTDAYGAWLPAGRYRFASWRHSRWNDGPEIEVMAGRITDLGDILEISLGGDDVVLLPIAHPELDTRLEPWLAEAGPHLSSKVPVRWLPEKVPSPIDVKHQVSSQSAGGGLMNMMMSLQREAYRREPKPALREIRSLPELQARVLDGMPPTRDEAAVGEQGRLYFGADFGRIRVREPEGRWRSLDTGTLADVTAVAWRDGLLLAGTDRGTLHASQDGGLTWTLQRRFDRNELIGDVDRVGDRWIVSTTHREYTSRMRRAASVRTTVYAATADDFSDLVELARFPQKFDNPFVQRWAPRGDGHGDYYYVGAYPRLQRLHVPSGEWTTLKVRGSVTGFAVSPTTGAVSAVANGFYLTTDHGETWTRLHAPGRKGNIAAGMFDSASQGWLARWRFPSASSEVLVVHELNRGAKGWKDQGDAPLGCRRLLRDAAGDPKLCALADGTLLRRADSDWIEEFSLD